MKTGLQIFNYSDRNIRTISIDGSTWFVADDVCRTLQYKQTGPAVKKHCREKGVTKHNILTEGGSQKMICIDEGNLYRLIAKCSLPEAEKFESWIFDEVLPTIRREGSYSLKNLVLSNPLQWEKTFPTEFFREVMRVYNYDYHPKQGTPQFVGHFINKYIYTCLDRNMSKELKLARVNYKSSTDEFAFLHQFLKDEGRVPLKSHIVSITTLLKATRTIDQFDLAFQRVYNHRNQLEMYLR